MSTTEERERAPRIAASLAVALSEAGAHYVADTVNVSATGVRLRPKKVFAVGTQLHLVFGQPPELPALSVQGIVRWSDGGKGAGVEFTSISAHDLDALMKFVNAQSRREQA